MLERFAKLIRRPKRGKAKGRKPKRWPVKRATGILAGLAQRPLVLVAYGAGIGLVIGALLATRQPSPATVAQKPVQQQLAVAAAPQSREVESEPAAPPPAALPAPSIIAPKTAAGSRPVWQQYAKAVPAIEGQPMIAIVIDDMGIDKAESARVIALPPQVTIAFMTYAKELARQAAAARAAGHELWLHVPMEPLDRGLDAGPNVLKTELTPEENRRRLDWALSQLDGYVGINNHMGSRFASSEADMRAVLEEVRARGVFIDNDETVDSVLAQLQRTEDIARKRGRALAIGHPHTTTIAALLKWLPTLKEKGFVLVPASALLHQETATAG